MRVKTVTVMQTRQVAKYEPERISLEVEVGKGESVLDAIARARATLQVAYGERMSVEDANELMDALEEERMRASYFG